MKYALFEFEFGGDNCIDVGETSWIANFDGLDLSSLQNWQYEKEVIVNWPKIRRSKGKKTKYLTEPHVAKVISFSDSKQTLISQRNELCSGKFEQKECDLGRGKRQKRQKKLSSSESSSEEDEDREYENQRKKSKKTSENSKMKQTDELARSLKQQLYGNVNSSYNSSAQNHKQKIQELEQELEECRKQNKRLLSTISFLKDIPCYIDSFEALVKAAKATTLMLQKPNNTVPRTTHVQGPAVRQKEPDQEQSSQDKISCLMSRCSKQDYKKFTSDLLVAVFGREKLATHSMTGGKSCKVEGKAKESLDQKKLDFVIDQVLTAFPDTAKEHIKMTITNKLSNESKMKKRRESKIIEEE